MLVSHEVCPSRYSSKGKASEVEVEVEFGQSLEREKEQIVVGLELPKI
jgi:hypothetical protein